MRKPHKVFADTMILKFGVIRRPAIEWRGVRWGPIEQRLPVYTMAPPERAIPEWLKKEVNCLRAVATFALEGRVEIYINDEIRLEVASTKYGSLVSGRESLFYGVKIKTIPPPFEYDRIIVHWQDTRQDIDRHRENILGTKRDQRFNQLKDALGANKNADAFHIYSAEKAGLDYYLTMDRKLINSIRNQRGVTFNIKVLYPSEFVAEIAGYAV